MFRSTIESKPQMIRTVYGSKELVEKLQGLALQKRGQIYNPVLFVAVF